MRVGVRLMVVALAESCAASERPKDMQTAIVLHDDRDCRLDRAKDESSECFAVRCAEDFVRRNGYTLDPATGPIVDEAIESPTVQERKGMLEKSAVGYKAYPPGHIVVFKLSSSSSELGRGVSMSREFGDLRVGHQGFFLSAAEPRPTCAPSR